MVLSHILDISHLTCPMALLSVKRALQQTEERELIICISDDAALKDIVRYCEKCGFSVQVKSHALFYHLTIKRESIE